MLSGELRRRCRQYCIGVYWDYNRDPVPHPALSTSKFLVLFEKMRFSKLARGLGHFQALAYFEILKLRVFWKLDLVWNPKEL